MLFLNQVTTLVESNSIKSGVDDDHREVVTIRRPSLIAIISMRMVESVVISLLKWRIMLPKWFQKMSPISLVLESVEWDLSTLILIEPTEEGTHEVLSLVSRGESGMKTSSKLW